MAREKQWTEAEAAALDAAFEAGVREALKRDKSLYMQLTQMPPVTSETPRPIWIALYPPRFIKADEVAEWCAHTGFRPTEDDLFFPREHVQRAARDLGITQ